MQLDGSASRTADLVSRCKALEKENKDLSAKCAKLDRVELELHSAECQVTLLESDLSVKNEMLDDLQREMRRREIGTMDFILYNLLFCCALHKFI
jgi:predicted RNase H-like nuclease (RuvC/YqgF family)